MPATTPIPSPVALFPTVEDWLDDMNTRFAANRYGQIDDADFRAVFTGMAQVFADWRHLNVKRVKGATYPVPFTDSLGLVAPEYRILGMQAVALNGTDSSTAAAGVVAPPIYYTLLRFNGGDVDALLDVEPDTTLTVKAMWVRTSGTEEEKVSSFPVLPLEDVVVYKGEVYQHTFTEQVPPVTRLLEIRQDIIGFSHPVPTGLDDDPYYKAFAPLSAGTGYDDTAVRMELATVKTELQLQQLRLLQLATTNGLPAGSDPERQYFSDALAVAAIAKNGFASTLLNGITTVYQNGSSAISQAPAGAIVRLYGFHDYVVVGRSDITLIVDQCRELEIGYGIFGPLNLTVEATVLGRFVVCGSYSGDTYNIKASIKAGPLTYMESYTRGCPNGTRTNVDLSLSYVQNEQAYTPPANGQAANGLFRFQERNYEGYTVWTLRAGRYSSRNNPIASGYLDSRTRINLENGVELVPGAGRPLQEAYRLNGGPITDEELFVDNRTVGGGPAYVGGDGIAIIGNVISATGAAGGSAPIDYANPVMVTQASEFPGNPAGKLLVLSGASFGVTLPDLPAKTLFEIRVAFDAPGLYTLVAPNGKTLDGQPSRKMWAQESALLQYTPTAISKLSGNKRGMKVEAWLVRSEQYGGGGPYDLYTPNVKVNKGFIFLNHNGGTSFTQYIFPRKGQARLTARWTGTCGTVGPVLAFIRYNGGYGNDVSSLTPAAIAPDGSYGMNVAADVEVNESDAFGIGLYNATNAFATITHDGQPQNTARVIITEIPEW